MLSFTCKTRARKRPPLMSYMNPPFSCKTHARFSFRMKNPVEGIPGFLAFFIPPTTPHDSDQVCQTHISHLPCSMTCPKRTVGPYVHLFLHSQYVSNDQWQRADLTMRQILSFSGHHTPDITVNQFWTYSFHPQARASNKAFHKTVSRDPYLQYGIYHQGFAVARQEWPKLLREAWQLNDPPIPYEVAAAVLKEPANHFFKLGINLAPEMQHNRSVFYWWLAGMHEEAIIRVMRGRPPRGKQKKDKGGRYLPQPRAGENEKVSLHEAMAAYIRYIMGIPKFAMWALGTNILPACTDRKMAQVAADIMLGKSSAELPVPEVKRAVKKLVTHPYIRTQLKTGQALHPISRTIYTPGILWTTQEEKDDWEREGSIGAQNIQQHRRILLKRAKMHPPWLQLPLYDTSNRKANG